MEDNSLIAFKAITNFTKELTSVFGKTHRPLKLYNHLITKTTLAHDEIIKKHIQAFREFCVENSDALYEKNKQKITKTKVEYSNRVYIDLKLILNKADRETSNVIWQHLLTISALVNPAGKAKQVLKELKEKSNNDSSNEIDFIQNLISKVETEVDPNANPLEAVTSIMQSGMFQNLVTDITENVNNGNFNINRMIGSLKGVITEFSEDGESENQATNILDSAMATLENTDMSNPEESMKNISGMFSKMLFESDLQSNDKQKIQELMDQSFTNKNE